MDSNMGSAGWFFWYGPDISLLGLTKVSCSTHIPLELTIALGYPGSIQGFLFSKKLTVHHDLGRTSLVHKGSKSKS